MIALDVWVVDRNRFAKEKIPKRELAKQLGVWRGTVDRALAAEIKLLPPRDPESKSMVERINRSFRRGFMSGCNFADRPDVNDQLDTRLSRANYVRVHSNGYSVDP